MEKVGSWMQMQIFCTENPDAVPIETDEELRLEYIGKSMKKNFLFSHVLLMAVFLMNMFTTFSTASRNWAEYLSDSIKLWNTGLWMWGIFILIIDIVVYLCWMRRAKKAVQDGRSCPEPKGYRYWTLVAWGVLSVLILGLFASYTSGMLWFMLIYLAGIFLIIFGVRKVQMKLKKSGVSKEGNWAVTMILCVLLSLLFVGGAVAAVFVFDISLTGKKEPVGTILFNGREWDVYKDELPLYVSDFAEVEGSNSSCRARVEKSSVLAEYGEYSEYLYEGETVSSMTTALNFEVITVKAGFLYDFLLNEYYEREFRYWDDEEKEYVEYRVVYEDDNGKFYRQYYNDGVEESVSAHEWLILTENKIVSMHPYLDDLTEEQMEIILEKFVQE